MPRPNILLIITHDSGRHFGCYGATIETPNIDRIGHEGVLFENAFCSAPQCSPARGSMLTGLCPHRNGLIGLTHRGFRLHADVPRLPALLATAGYHTLLFGLHHEEPDAHQMGYRRVLGGPDRTIRDVLPEVEAFLASQPPQPFFACVGFSESHRPFDPARYPMDNPDEMIVPEWLPDEPAVRTDVAELNGTIRGVDEAVGRIDSGLAAAGLANNTLLVYTTDHGTAFPYAKATLFDAGLGVALVARGPGGFIGGRTVHELVGMMDLTPTLLEVAGANVPDNLDGRSVLPLLAAGQSVEWRGEIFAEQTYHAAYDPMRSVRTERFKYIRSFEPRPILFAPNVDESPSKALLMKRNLYRQPRAAEMLFDLQDDPAEQHNLAEDPNFAHALSDLRARLLAWMERSDDPLLAGVVPPPPGARVTPAGAIKPEQFDAPADWRGK
ncbi:MAG: sulfatase [Phycisphaerae bacterium]|nr:sulfatase [Phycisphaerae bacterium]